MHFMGQEPAGLSPFAGQGLPVETAETPHWLCGPGGAGVSPHSYLCNEG